jgi:hypothetical protein
MMKIEIVSRNNEGISWSEQSIRGGEINLRLKYKKPELLSLN